MSEAYVLFAVLGAFGVALFAGARAGTLLPWLLAGYLLRVLLLGMYAAGWFLPPGADMDAARFTRVAVEYSALGWSELVGVFNYRSGFSYSILGAVLFKTFGYHDLVLPVTNLLLGVANISIASLTVYRLFGLRPAAVAGMLIALYPFAAFNSVVALREELGIFFFLIGLAFTARWVRLESFGAFLFGNVFFGFAALIHPGFIAAMVASALFFCYHSGSALRNHPAGSQQAVLPLLAGLGIAAAGGVLLSRGIELGKGIELTLEADVLAETLGSRFQSDPLGGSGYPAAIATGNPVTQPWLIPARMLYFLYSPFPWDVRSPIHLVGVIVSGLYLWLSYRAFKCWRSGGLAGRRRVFPMMFLLLSFIFAMGVTNSGTAIRHKTKFFPLLVLIAAPSFRTRIVVGQAPPGRRTGPLPGPTEVNS